MYRLMWIFVEGSDDRIFVERVLHPILEEKYDCITTWEYARKRHEKTAEFIRSVRSMQADYLFLADIDDSPCVTAKKDTVATKYCQAVESANAIIVAREIESWYMAGVDNEICRELAIRSPFSTDDMTKEQFRRLIPRRFNESAVDFMVELLRRFRVDSAKDRNRSFRYLMDLLETRSEKA